MGDPDRRQASRRHQRHGRDRLFELTQDLLAVAGLDGAFRQNNPSWERMAGWTTAEFQGRPITDFVHQDDSAMVKHTLEKLKGGGATSFEARFTGKDNRS